MGVLRCREILQTIANLSLVAPHHRRLQARHQAAHQRNGQRQRRPMHRRNLHRYRQRALWQLIKLAVALIIATDTLMDATSAFAEREAHHFGAQKGLVFLTWYKSL